MARRVPARAPRPQRAPAPPQLAPLPLALAVRGAGRLREPLPVRRLALPGVGAARRSCCCRWPRYWTSASTLVANLLGYMPLGALAVRRAGPRRPRRAAPSALLACARRRAAVAGDGVHCRTSCRSASSSNVDWALNALGTAVGVALGAALHWRGGIERWQTLRERWFVARSAGGAGAAGAVAGRLAVPAAVPFGLGHVLGRSQEVVVDLLDDTPAGALVRRLAAGARSGDGAQRCRRRPSSRSSRSACSRRAWSPSRSPRRAGAASCWSSARSRSAAAQHAVDRAQLRPGARARLDHAAGAAARSPRRGAGAAAQPRCRAAPRPARPGRADGARRCWSRRRRPTRTSPEPAGLGAGPLHPLPRRWRSGSAGCGRTRRSSTCSCAAGARASRATPGVGASAESAPTIRPQCP